MSILSLIKVMNIFEIKKLYNLIVENHNKFIDDNHLLFRKSKEGIGLINKLNIYDEINKLKIYISDIGFKELKLYFSEHTIYKDDPLCELIVKNQKNFILPYEINYIKITTGLYTKEINKFNKNTIEDIIINLWNSLCSEYKNELYKENKIFIEIKDNIRIIYYFNDEILDLILNKLRIFILL